MDGTSLPERPKPSAKPPKPPKAPKAPKAPKSVKKPDKQPRKDISAAEDLPPVQDPNFMFKTGFLADVYRERPVSDQLPRVMTRMPPEPNVSNNDISCDRRLTGKRGTFTSGIVRLSPLTLALRDSMEAIAFFATTIPTLRAKNKSTSFPLMKLFHG